jgi:hypothetical protein
MSAVERGVAGLVAVLMMTTLVLPRRQTPQVIDKFFTGMSRLSATAIGTRAG